MRKVDVIVPVYKGIDETQECIVSAVQSIDPDVGRLIVINDASPEPELVVWLEEAAQKFGFTLLHNAVNLGFVATVNRGMRLHLDCDVLLLNSDVEVHGDWLTRVREGAYLHERTASITPFSNNATICSFPDFCQDNGLLFGLPVAELDEHFAAVFSVGDLTEIPTGIGFCMYLRRDCLDDVGYFDVETFGKGYGEENDWCQRAEKKGWPNYLQANVFVYHKGGVSFDLEQEPRKAKAMELLALKHPDYDAKIQTFIAEDPTREFRIKALWSLFANLTLPKALMITHRLGGGVQQHVNELSYFYAGKALFLQLRPLEDGASVSLSICGSEGSLLDSLSYQIESEYEQLVELLSSLGVGRVHFHHTMGLHTRLWGLPCDLDCQYDITVHDYYFINGNPTLTNGKARFVGDDYGYAFDQACAEAYPIPVSAKQWRCNVGELIEKADRLIFPSSDACQRFSQFFSTNEAIVAWHPDHILAKPYPEISFKDTRPRPLRILVLGALSREKGADLLEQIAEQLSGEGFEFHLAGYAYRALSASVFTLGPYENGEASELIDSVSADVIWFPALWPETYSYTLSHALEKGLPVVVPDIGAFTERVRGRSNVATIPWNSSVETWLKFWREVKNSGELCGNDAPMGGLTEQTAEFYSASYLAKIETRPASLNVQLIESIQQHYRTAEAVNTVAESVLNLMWRLSKKPVFSRVFKWIPFDIKRAVKRRLSVRSMREIIDKGGVS